MKTALLAKLVLSQSTISMSRAERAACESPLAAGGGEATFLKTSYWLVRGRSWSGGVVEVATNQ